MCVCVRRQVYQKSRDDGRPPVNGATNGDAGHDSQDDDGGDSDDWQVRAAAQRRGAVGEGHARCLQGGGSRTVAHGLVWGNGVILRG